MSTHICLALRRLLTFCLSLTRNLCVFIFQTFAEVCYSVFVKRSSFKSRCWIFVKLTYLRVCWRSTIDLCLMNLPKRSSFKSLLKVYTLSKILLWIKPSYFSLENACDSWCMHQIGLFSSASVVPQSKFTGELWRRANFSLRQMRIAKYDGECWCKFHVNHPG